MPLTSEGKKRGREREREICLFWQRISGQPMSGKLQMTYVKLRGQIKFCLASEGLKEAS